MKKIFLAIILVLMVFTIFSNEGPSMSLGIGGTFFNGEDEYLNMAIKYIHPLDEGMELDLGVDFGVATEKGEGDESEETKPAFFIPVNLGLNFTFPTKKNVFLIGLGVSPVVKYREDETHLYVGPFIKVGTRLRIHELLKLFVEVQQDLLIGEPDWINTSTRVNVGLNFLVSPVKE